MEHLKSNIGEGCTCLLLTNTLAYFEMKITRAVTALGRGRQFISIVMTSNSFVISSYNIFEHDNILWFVLKRDNKVKGERWLVEVTAQW
jgi:hypothetical protein